MSFNIFASGVKGGGGNFQYTKDGCVDRDSFEPPALLSMIPSSPDAQGIAEAVGGTTDSYLGGAAVNTMAKIGSIEIAHLIRYSVTSLAMHGSGGEISVYCLQQDWLWGDTNSFVTFKMSHSTNPGRDFLKAIAPALVKTELNNFGVLLQISNALSKYDAALSQSATPFLTISLSR